MSGFAKAYARFGSQSMDDITNAFNQIKQKQQQDEFYNNFLGAVSDYQKSQSSLNDNANNPSAPTNNPMILNDSAPLVSPRLSMGNTTLPNGLGSLGTNNTSNIPVNNLPVTAPAPLPVNQSPLNLKTNNAPVSSLPVNLNFNNTTKASVDPFQQKQQKYQLSKDALNQFVQRITPMLASQNITPEQTAKLNSIYGVLSNQVESLKPTPPEIVTAKDGEEFYRRDPVTHEFLDKDASGSPIPYFSNDKETKTALDKPGEKITDAGGHPYQSFLKGDNTTYLKDMVTNKVVTPEEAAKLKFKDPNGGDALGWANYNMRAMEYNQNKQDKKDALNQKLSDTQQLRQNEYNDIMGTRIPLADLINDGLAQTTDKTKSDYLDPNSGGAYVVRDKNTQKARLITDEKVLSQYAKNRVPDAPNKWERQKDANGNINTVDHYSGSNNTTQKTNNKFIEGKTYIDGNGKKAKYVNGQFQEVK